MIVTCLPLLFEMCLFAYCTHSIKMTSTKKVMTKVSRIQFIKCRQKFQFWFLKPKSRNSLTKLVYSHGQELFYKFVSNFTNKLVKQLLSMTVLQK